MSSFTAPEANRAQAGLAVPASPAEMGGWLPEFDSVVAMTVNSAVSMTQTGSYAPPSAPGESVGCCPHQVNLRIDPALFGTLVAAPRAETDAPDCLQFIGRDQNLLHRGFLSSPHDRAVFRSLQMRGQQAWEPLNAQPWCRPAGPCGAERARLIRADLVRHLDSVLSDDGTRAITLPTCGAELVSSADVAEAIGVLGRAGELDLPTVFAVPVRGLMHTCAGPVDALHRTPSGLNLRVGAATLGIEPEALGSAWVIRPAAGPAFIEFHDTEGRCVLVVASAADHASPAAIRWEHLTAMLALIA